AGEYYDLRRRYQWLGWGQRVWIGRALKFVGGTNGAALRPSRPEPARFNSDGSASAPALATAPSPLTRQRGVARRTVQGGEAVFDARARRTAGGAPALPIFKYILRTLSKLAE